MFAYNLPDGLPAGSRTLWSQLPLQPLATQPLTPFSHSIIDEVAKSAWYQYFDELGFDPTPRAQVVRQQEGRVYLNLTISAQRDSEGAAVEPPTLLLNGQPYVLAKWEKPGFLANLKIGRSRKKIEQVLEGYRQQIGTVTQNAAAWYAKTQELRWTQADILQVMEEIERVSLPSFKIFFAARHNLELIYNRLLWATQSAHPFPANLPLVYHAVHQAGQGGEPLVEERMATELLTLGAHAAADPATVSWLATQQYDQWQTTLPNQSLAAAITRFLQTYGHRCVEEGEIRSLRWQQDPSPVFAGLRAYTQQPASQPTGAATPQGPSLLDAVGADQRKSVQQQLQQARQLLLLQSQALHAYAYILAGTQRWALAAAKEAASDQRVRQVEEIFFFQLEEVKQMMTGEWNVSARQEIQHTCDKRKADFARWQQTPVPPLVMGSSAAVPVHTGLPGTAGQATGPLRHWTTPQPAQEPGVVVSTPHLDSGWALALPFVRGLVSATGTPLDPIVATAQSWQIPTVLGLASQATLVEGVPTTVQGERGEVTQ